MDTFDTVEIEEAIKTAVNEGRAERPKKKKLHKGYVIIGALALAVILFAFIWEAVIGDVTLVPKSRTTAVQEEITKLSWITPRLLPPNDYSRPATPVTKVNAIAIHYVGNPGTSAEQNRNFFANLAFTAETYASSNFIVGLDGEILQCVPVSEVAYCTPSRNEDTISIEVCHPDETGQFSDVTYASVIRLTAYLCGKFNLTAGDLLRHYDVTEKECPIYYVENPEAWEQFKADVDAAIEAAEAA